MTDDTGESLYDRAQPIDNADLKDHIEREFVPLEDENEKESRMARWREEYPYPAVWLLRQKGRASLVDHALEEITTSGNPSAYPKAQIAERADVSRQTVHDYIEDLVSVGIFDTEGNRRVRYRADPDSEVLDRLQDLNETILQHNPTPTE